MEEKILEVLEDCNISETKEILKDVEEQKELNEAVQDLKTGLSLIQKSLDVFFVKKES